MDDPLLTTTTSGPPLPFTPTRPSNTGRTIYSDRFIPSRSGSNFALFDLSPPSTSSSSSSPSTIADGGSGGAGAPTNDGSSAYLALLRTVLFGPEYGVASPSIPEKSPDGRGSSPLTPPSRNIFRFKTENRRPYRSISPYDFDGALPGVVTPPPKAPRKVPRSPFKVLDAPALQDDFYLNLVDWSSHNVLAVGLGNCVYLWNACSARSPSCVILGRMTVFVWWAGRSVGLTWQLEPTMGKLRFGMHYAVGRLEPQRATA